MPAFARTLAITAALTSTAVLGSGCELLEAFNQEDSTLVQLMVTHHATPENGHFPNRADGELRTFETDEGWTVFLQTAYVTTSHASLHGCNGSSVDFEDHWGPLPENIGHEDLDLLSFGAVEVSAGSYCELTVEYGPFVPSADQPIDMGDSGDKVEGTTYYFEGVAQKGDLSFPFVLSSSAPIVIDADISKVMEGGPLEINANEAFPVELTIAKTYDRLFDGVDFESISNEDLNASVAAMLELETRVSFGTRVAAE